LLLAWRIDDVPAGDYHVFAVASSVLPIEPQSHTAAAPAAGLDFVVRNTAEFRWYDWQVVDAATRAPLENVSVEIELREGVRRRVLLDRSPAERFPLGSEVRWTAHCAGYESRSGTLADCDRAVPRDARTDQRELIHKAMREVWVCDLELERADH
jgi:hypothetical protein